MISSKPFEAVVAAVEGAIGRPDMREFEKAAQLRDRIRSLKQRDLSGLFSTEKAASAP